MSSHDIYSVSGTVQAANGIYISRKADGELLALTRAGDFAYVLTTRQLGKSSLMIHTAEQLRREGIRNVVIDLGQIGVGVTSREWYLGLLAEIERALELNTTSEKWFNDHSHLGMIHRMTTFFAEVLLKETTDRVVIFVDEIDTTLGLDFTDDFFAAIRYFYNARAHVPEFKRLSFVLIGTAAPGDLIRDPVRTPFNIGHQVDLTDFTFEETLPLAAGLGLEDDQARQVLRWILKWTNGHPYLTQRICKELAEQGRVDWTQDQVNEFVNRTFLRPGSAPDRNLVFVRDMLTKRAPNGTTVLTTYQRIRAGKENVYDEVQSIPKNHLKLSGIVRPEKRGEKTVLDLRNPIYKEVFNERWTSEHLPINWLKRARQAGLFAAVFLLVASVGVLGFNYWAAAQKLKRTEEQRDEIVRVTEGNTYRELQKHFGEPSEPPEQTAVLLNSPERGSLELKLFRSDNCILIERTGPAPNHVKTSTWVLAPPAGAEKPPDHAPDEEHTHNETSGNPQFFPASISFLESLSPPAFGCLNPHPGAFSSWYGARNGCWLALYRKWRDGCQHYQWFNSCYGYWDPGIHWTRCVH